MKLVVGLGNVGTEYDNTRHNIGFMVLDSFVKDFKLEKKFQTYLKKELINQEEVLFMKPTTFMNLSGIAVQKVISYYHIEPKNVLVIQDDMDLDFGKHKIKVNSSSGGHNGIKSIIESLGTNGFYRLKIGISHDSNHNSINHVLGRFTKDDMQFFEKQFSLYEEIIKSFLLNGPERTMNKYNTK